MNKMTKAFVNQLELKEKMAVRDMAVLASHIAAYSGTLTEGDNRQVQRLVDKAADTLFNIKIIRSIPISMN